MKPSVPVRPVIKLFYSERLADKQKLRQILYGAEEEGVPVEAQLGVSDDVLALAYEAANASVLETGIGVSSTDAAVQFQKIPMERPLYQIGLKESGDALRKVGANAARLVKKMPLKGGGESWQKALD